VPGDVVERALRREPGLEGLLPRYMSAEDFPTIWMLPSGKSKSREPK
jgi:hypothetical protein